MFEHQPLFVTLFLIFLKLNKEKQNGIELHTSQREPSFSIGDLLGALEVHDLSKISQMSPKTSWAATGEGWQCIAGRGIAVLVSQEHICANQVIGFCCVSLFHLSKYIYRGEVLPDTSFYKEDLCETLCAFK